MTKYNDTIHTEQYEFAHGRRPLGWGVWAFDCMGWTQGVNGGFGGKFMETLFIPHAMPYGKACAWVRKNCPEGTTEISTAT